ncbi:MAG: hypothetical protein ACYC4U_17670 [Pirellulaceae bacterium]
MNNSRQWCARRHAERFVVALLPNLLLEQQAPLGAVGAHLAARQGVVGEEGPGSEGTGAGQGQLEHHIAVGRIHEVR